MHMMSLDESDDDDCHDQNLQAKITSGLENMKKSHQNLLFTGKDAQNSKKFQQLLRVKDEYPPTHNELTSTSREKL